MPEIRTADCVEANHPEFSIHFDDPADEPRVAKWAEGLVEAVWDGKVFTDGARGRFWGWPVRYVLQDGVFVVEEDDLTGPDASPRFAPGLSFAARWTRRQVELAEGHDLSSIQVDARYGVVKVCRDAYENGSLERVSRLARSESAGEMVHATLEKIHGTIPKPHDTGWYFACGDTLCRGRSALPRTGAPPSHAGWIDVRVPDIFARRDELAPYLSLAPGSVVELWGPLRDRVGRHPPDVPLDPAWNVLRMPVEEPSSRRFALLLDVVWAKLREGSAEKLRRTRDLALDPERDGTLVWEALRWRGAKIISQKFGVDEDAARRALRRVCASPQREQWLASKHRATFTPEAFDAALRALDGAASNTERWRVHNDVARALHQMTGEAFATLKPRVEALDADWALLARGGR